MPKSRDARQDDAIVALLEALPSDRLEAILGRVAPDLKPAAAAKRDARLCFTCGKTYPLCRKLWADDHEFTVAPTTSRSSAPAQDVERGDSD